MTLDRAGSAGEACLAADSTPSCSRNRAPALRALALAMRWLVAPLLAIALASGCDRPFHPVAETPKEPFWIFGYLDLRADTQWIRVMPVRENLLTDPSPIDAVVTLEDVKSGRTVTLNDSLFSFRDERLDGVAYAHNFWTTEHIEPKGQYRLRAVRSDGAATTALIDMPADLEFSFLNLEGGGDTARVQIRAERVLFVEMIHGIRTAAGEPAGVIVKRQPAAQPTSDPGIQALDIDESPPFQVGRVEIGRAELRIASARSDWPYDPRLPDKDIVLPESMPSNVENGVGFVGGVATWTIPFHRCRAIGGRSDQQNPCAITYDSRSASVAGRVIREPCGRPATIADVRLMETFAGGGGVVLSWKTGWDGRFRFEGIEPGAELALQLGPDAPDLQLPRLAPGQRYVLGDISVSAGC